MNRSFELKNLMWFSFLFLVGIVFLGVPLVHAQTASPQFLITWITSGSYIPSFYQGKALPTYGSQITASVELISAGKLINLKSQTIYWYLNDSLVGGGTGVQSVSFPPFGTPPSTLTLKIELPSYNGNFLVDAIQIPMVEPQAVIYAPYPYGQFSVNPVSVNAIPYFFNTSNASNLSYSWTVNGQTGSSAENPEEANISLPQGSSAGDNIAVSLTISNSTDSTSGNASENLTYENQL